MTDDPKTPTAAAEPPAADPDPGAAACGDRVRAVGLLAVALADGAARGDRDGAGGGRRDRDRRGDRGLAQARQQRSAPDRRGRRVRRGDARLWRGAAPGAQGGGGRRGRWRGLGDHRAARRRREGVPGHGPHRAVRYGVHDHLRQPGPERRARRRGRIRRPREGSECAALRGRRRDHRCRKRRLRGAAPARGQVLLLLPVPPHDDDRDAHDLAGREYRGRRRRVLDLDHGVAVGLRHRQSDVPGRRADIVHVQQRRRGRPAQRGDLHRRQREEEPVPRRHRHGRRDGRLHDPRAEGRHVLLPVRHPYGYERHRHGGGGTGWWWRRAAAERTTAEQRTAADVSAAAHLGQPRRRRAARRPP